jgi:hypothetical protein
LDGPANYPVYPPNSAMASSNSIRDAFTGFRSAPSAGLGDNYSPDMGGGLDDDIPDSGMGFYGTGLRWFGQAMKEGLNFAASFNPFFNARTAATGLNANDEKVKVWTRIEALFGVAPTPSLSSIGGRIGRKIASLPSHKRLLRPKSLSNSLVSRQAQQTRARVSRQLSLPFDDLPEPLPVIEQHHPYPKYLGGAEDQPLVGLPDWYHRLIHKDLDKTFPRQKGTDYWDAERRKDPLGFRIRVWQALSETYNKYPLTSPPGSSVPFPWTKQGM